MYLVGLHIYIIKFPFSVTPLLNGTRTVAHSRAVSRSRHSTVLLSKSGHPKENTCKQPSCFKHFTSVSGGPLKVWGWEHICLSLFTNKSACVSPALTNHVSGPISRRGTNLFLRCVGRLDPTAASFLSLPMSARFNFAFTMFRLPHISKFFRRTVLQPLHF